MTVTLPWPPTLNNLYATVRGRRVLTASGRRYRASVKIALLEQLGRFKPIAGELTIVSVFNPPDRRRRDEDNYHKALRDALTWCGLIGDDCQFRESHNYWLDPVPGGQVEITIESRGA